MVRGCLGCRAGVEGELSHLPWITGPWQGHVDFRVAHVTPKRQCWPVGAHEGSLQGWWAHGHGEPLSPSPS